jgi:hypothetical protein
MTLAPAATPIGATLQRPDDDLLSQPGGFEGGAVIAEGLVPDDLFRREASKPGGF